VAFDMTAACSGFVVALLTAVQFIRTGARKRVVVVGADALSRYVDWTDRGVFMRCCCWKSVFVACTSIGQVATNSGLGIL
jgi:3-oxoacyl-[acyl-carrier-protein] synthase III